MLALARATSARPNATVFRPCTHARNAKHAIGTRHQSSDVTADEFAQGAISSESKATSVQKIHHTGPRHGVDPSQSAKPNPRRPQDLDRGQQRFLKYRPWPQRIQIPHRGTVDHNKKRLGDMTSDDLTKTAITPPKQFKIRKQAVRPFPTVVTFSDLREQTTIEDVLLCIREAAVAGKIGSDESRILDVRIRTARTRDKKAPPGMVARVEFLHSHGASQMHNLARSNRFEILGVKPRTMISLSHNLPGGEALAGARRGTSVGSLGMMHAPSKAVKKLIDQMRLKDKLVRRTHLVHNRCPSAASEDESQLQIDVAFRSTRLHDSHDVDAMGSHVGHQNGDKDKND